MSDPVNVNADECCVNITLTQEELVRFQHTLWLARLSGDFCYIKPVTVILDNVIKQIYDQQPQLVDGVIDLGDQICRGEAL
jgi:hypothetical protein